MKESPLFLDLKRKIRAAIGTGDLAAALVAADEALVEARSTGDDETVDLAVCNRSAVMIEQGDYSSELSQLKPILLRTTNPVVAFAAAYSTARIYQERRDFKKAISYARIAREKSLQTDDHPGRAHVLNQLGTLCLLETRVPEAIDYFVRVRPILETTEPQDPLLLAILDDNLGYAFMLDGRYEDGLSLCHRALSSIEATGAETYAVQPHLDLCFGYLELQNFDSARFHGERGLELALRHGVDELLKNALYLVGEVAHLSGNTERAEECFDELAALYPEVRYLRGFLFSIDLKKVINLRQ